MTLSRGDIVRVDLSVPIGHEAGFERPALVVSHDSLAVTGLVVVCAVTRTRHGWPSHVEIEPAQSGLPEVSYVQTEQLRTISTQRLMSTVGHLDVVALVAVETRLRTNLVL